MTYRAEIIFVIILPSFSTGILISYGLHFTELNLVLLIFCLSSFIIILLIRFLYKSIKVYNHKAWSGLALNIFFLSLGAWLCEHYKTSTNSDNFTRFQADYLQIRVAEEPQLRNHILRFSAEVLHAYTVREKHKSTGNLLVAIRTDSLRPIAINYGEVYFIPGTYTNVLPPSNPAEFDFQFWLANRNIHQQIFLHPQQINGNEENSGNPIIRFSLNLRKQQVAYYHKLLKDDEAFAVASTLILGYRADLSAETLAAYSKTGTIHALSVSGMHVGIIYIVIEWALRFLNRKRSLKFIKLLLVLTLIWFYTILTGCSASVLRSAIMLSVFVLAKAWDRNSNSYNILAFSAFCLLLYNPFLVWDVGFQLSFLSVFGLIYLQPLIHQLVYLENKWLEKLWSLISLSLAAQIVTFPLSIYYFHQFPVYFIISNLFINIPITFLMYIGIVILILKFDWIGPVFEWLIIFNNKGLEFISRLPYSSIGAIWINRIELILLCLFLSVFIVALEKFSKRLLLSSLIILLFFQMHITWDKLISYQQNNSIVFKLHKNFAVTHIFSQKAYIATDLKVTDKTFIFSVQPALDQLRVKEIVFIK